MPDSSLYLRAADELRENPGQWAAYESKGHCVVLAGPGSGKTKTLTIKLARFLAEDVREPRGVACITYNNECARELETRLEILGIEAGRRAFIGTVHSFSLTQVILPYAKAANLGLPDEFDIATRTETGLALERAFRRTIGGPENPQDYEFRMGIYRRSILNRNSVVWRTRDPAIAGLVEAYEEELRALGKIDFDDMPLIALGALRENAWLQRALYAKYPILIVDEYQDLGRALHRMVMGLCFHSGLRLFAVGDVDQSIYGFTGANPELLKQLSDRDDVETIQLRLNYRCGSQIVTASSYVLGEERDYEAANGAERGTIFFHPMLGTYEDHAEQLFSTIIPEVMERNPNLRLGDIGVLYPAAWIGDSVAEVARVYDTPVLRTDGNAIYPRGSRLMRWLEQCARWCAGGWQSGSPRFSRIQNDADRLFADALLTDDQRLEFRQLLLTTLWARRDSTQNLHDWLVELKLIILADLIIACPTMNEEVETLEGFITRASDGGDCAEMVLGQFAGMGEGNDTLNLSTLHSSKGREFPIVIMFGMDAGRIPRNNPSARDLRESRRLFYVGFTRAKSELHMVYSDNRASPFVTEVKVRLVEEA